MRDKIIDTAMQVAFATEWSGNVRVNFLTASRSARILAGYIQELEKELARVKSNDLYLELDDV